MKLVVYALTLLLWVLVSIQIGIAQSGIISTYAGPTLPTNGMPAATQVVDSAMGVIADGVWDSISQAKVKIESTESPRRVC